MSNLKKFKKYAVIFAVIVLPLAYSFFYLDAFWDPYSKLSDLPIAVVNQDEGSTINNQDRNIGNQIANRLENDSTLKWIVTSHEDAQDGVNNRKYYAEVIIPKDFSKQIASVDSQNKTKGIIVYQPNEKRNFLAGQILGRVMIEFKSLIAEDISSEIVNQMVVQIKKVPDDLTKLNDGLGQLYDGSDQLNSGLTELKDNQLKFNTGINTLNSGLKDVKSGSSKITTGSIILADGLNQFYDKLSVGSKDILSLITGSNQFKTGLIQLNNGTKQLSTGVTNLKNGSASLYTGTTEYTKNMTAFNTGVEKFVDGTLASLDQNKKVGELFTAYIQAHPEAMKDTQIQQIAAIMKNSTQGVQQLTTGAQTLKSSSEALNQAAVKINEGSKQLADGTALLESNVGTLSQGTSKLAASYGQIDAGINTIGNSMSIAAQNAGLLANGAKDLNNGIATLDQGLAKLNDGGSQLNNNASKFIDGEEKLIDGSNKIKTGLNEAKTGVSDSLTKAKDQLKSTEDVDKYVSNPIELKEDKINPVPNYGTAFAPYFISLSLWVGALLMFFSIYMDPDVRFRKGKNKRRYAIYFGYIGLGAIQAFVLCFVLQRGLNLSVKNVGVFYAVALMISLSFIGIMQFLIVHLKKVGQFLAILLLILQLTSCGGTFPMELVPKFFNVINPFMPMTYSVNALKEAISGADYGYLYFNLGILGAMMVVFLGLSLFLSSKKDDNDPEFSSSITENTVNV